MGCAAVYAPPLLSFWNILLVGIAIAIVALWSILYRPERAQSRLSSEVGAITPMQPLENVGLEKIRFVLDSPLEGGGFEPSSLSENVADPNRWRVCLSLEDVFELQDRVAVSVAGVIEPTLQAAEMCRSAARPTTDLTA
jgi:hypothetical protein